MTDAMRDAVGGDFAFYNQRRVRLNELRKGEITMEKIYKMEPFSNYIVVHEWNLNKMEDFILKDYNRGKDPGKRYTITIFQVENRDHPEFARRGDRGEIL